MSQCQAKTAKGVNCKKKALPGSHFCSIHNKKSPVKSTVKSPTRSLKKTPTTLCEEAVNVLGEEEVKRILTKAMSKSNNSSPIRSSSGDVMVVLALRPFLIREDSSGNIKSKPYGNKNWDKALQIVGKSLSLLEKFIIKTESYLISAGSTKGKYQGFKVFLRGPRGDMIAAIDGKPSDYEAELNQIENYIKDNYGNAAADTWMEGDISIDNVYELDLKLEELKIMPFK